MALLTAILSALAPILAAMAPVLAQYLLQRMVTKADPKTKIAESKKENETAIVNGTGGQRLDDLLNRVRPRAGAGSNNQPKPDA